MKSCKKLISIFAVFTMLFSMAGSLTVNATVADMTPSMTISIPENVSIENMEVGTTFEITVEYADVEGLFKTNVNNQTALTMLQFKMPMPEGFEVDVADGTYPEEIIYGTNPFETESISYVDRVLTYAHVPTSKGRYVVEGEGVLCAIPVKVTDVPTSDVTFTVTDQKYIVTELTEGSKTDEVTYTDSIVVTPAVLKAPVSEITVKSVNVTPAAPTVAGEAQQTFTAEVIGSDDNPYSDQSVTWSASAGTITEEGVFTAPAATDEEQTITIRATSDADDSVSGTATVTVPKKEVPQPQDPTTEITANNGTGGVYFDVTMNGSGESITGANVVVDGPTADGEGKTVTFNIIGYGDVQGELSFILGLFTEIAGEYTGTSNVETGVGTASNTASVTFSAQ